MEEEPRYVGIDVSKAQVDVAVRPTGQRWAASYNETGVGELVSQIVDIGPAMVLLEATGGLELPLVTALAAAALPVVVVNPRQVRDFARATGTLAKTDSLDAAVLAHFADAVRPSVRPLRDAETQVLNSLAARQASGANHVGLGEEPAGDRYQRRSPPHRSPHHLAGTGVERLGRRAEADSPPEPRVAREG